MTKRLVRLVIGTLSLLMCGAAIPAGRGAVGIKAVDRSVMGVPSGRPGDRIDYRVSITNNMPHPMDFFYTEGDGTTEHHLGTVAATSTRGFVISSPASTTITIIERGDTMTGFVASRQVTLQPDSAVEVSLWPAEPQALGAAVPLARGPMPAAIPTEWPTGGWRESSPEAQGIDSRALAGLFAFVHEHRLPIHSLLVIRNARVVLDASFFPYHSTDLHDLASATKSVTSTLIGIAIGQHQLAGVRQPVLPLFPQRAVTQRDARKERLTVEDLLTMTPGLACEWMRGEITLDSMRRSSDWVQFVLDRPMTAEPGRTFAYCSPGMHLLSGVISQVTGASALAFARRELFQPLGIADADWPADAQGVSTGWGDLHLRPRDMAKLGLLWLARGEWDGRHIVPQDWMSDAERAHVTHMGEGYGYGLWVYPDRQPPVFEANGRGGQRISVVPALQLVVVMTGGGFEPGDIGGLIGAAVKSDHALPENGAGMALLDSAVAAAVAPPPPHPVFALPSLATGISGRRWALDANPLGITALTLTFPSSSEAGLRLEFADGRLEQRVVGLDGVPRVSSGGRFGLPVAVSGDWDGATTFAFDYDEVANINCFQFRLAFSEHAVDLEIHERTGLWRTHLRGREATNR